MRVSLLACVQSVRILREAGVLLLAPGRCGFIDLLLIGLALAILFHGALLGREAWVERWSYSAVRSRPLWAVMVP